MTFRIAQISDTHLSDAKPFFVDNFIRIGEALRESRPDLVVNSGDISLDGADESDPPPPACCMTGSAFRCASCPAITISATARTRRRMAKPRSMQPVAIAT